MTWTQIVVLVATVLGSGWFAAFIVQALKQPSWPSWLKLVLSWAVAGLVGLAAAYLSGDVWHVVTPWQHGTLTATQVLTFATLVWTTAQYWYRQHFVNSAWARALLKWPMSLRDR